MKSHEAYCRGKFFIDTHNLLHVNFSSPIRSPIVSTISTGANALASITAWHHRPSNKREDGFIGGDTPHDLRWDGLIAS